jgi:uncharacterized membrane protein YphA (DoxX/SURF4 family)
MTLAAASFGDLPTGQHLAFALQLGLGAVFVASAVPKLRDPRAFGRTVVEYRILPPAPARVAAPALIAVECVLAIGFLAGALPAATLALATVTLLVFAAATAVNLKRGRDVSCGCFGDPTERISARTLVRLGLLLAGVAVLALALASADIHATTIGGLADHGASALAYLVEVGGLAVVLVFAAVWALHLPEVGHMLRRAVAGRAG